MSLGLKLGCHSTAEYLTRVNMSTGRPLASPFGFIGAEELVQAPKRVVITGVPSGSTAQGALCPQVSPYTSSDIGRRRTGPWFPAGRPRVMVAAIATSSGR